MITHKGTQTITTDRLVLRRFTVDDAKEMFNNWANDSRVTKYLRWAPHGDVENTRALLKMWVDGYQNDSVYNWAIEYDGKVIGNIGTVGHSDRHEYAEMGYCMGYDWWGKGIMTEALTAVIGYLFDEVGFHRITAEHNPQNIGSGRVMQKAGMSYEGTRRQVCRNRTDGSWYDLACYAILATDPRK